jgi:DNA-directed RNA polymerase subunit RPC12/RpoP
MTTGQATKNRVHLRLISCPECNHQFEVISHRLPGYCVECGNPILMKLRQSPMKYILLSDKGASIIYNTRRNADRVLVEKRRAHGKAS